MLEFHPAEYDDPIMIYVAILRSVVPKGAGFAFPVSSDRKNDASAVSSTYAFPITQANCRFALSPMLTESVGVSFTRA